MPRLILTRNHKESVVVETPEGRRIVITVLPPRGRGSRLSFEADSVVKITRSELLQREETK